MAHTTTDVIVIAHPDDESMFFLPTIRSLVDGERSVTTTASSGRTSNGVDVGAKLHRTTANKNYKEPGREIWLICLTTGNYDGLGHIRTKELITACELIGISKLFVFDGESESKSTLTSTDRLIRTTMIRDHPKDRWDPEHVATVIHQLLVGDIGTCYSTTGHDRRLASRKTNDVLLQQRKINLITFDEYGVSGHINHIDTYDGVCQLMKYHHQQQPLEEGEQQQSEIKEKQHSFRRQPSIVIESAWKLRSERNIVAKYIPIWSWILLFVHLMRSMITSALSSPVLSASSSPASSSSTTSLQQHYIHRLNDPQFNWRAMKAHASQFVWYRRLFVVFSCYTYSNTLIPIMISSSSSSAATDHDNNKVTKEDDGPSDGHVDEDKGNDDKKQR